MSLAAGAILDANIGEGRLGPDTETGEPVPVREVDGLVLGTDVTGLVPGTEVAGLVPGNDGTGLYTDPSCIWEDLVGKSSARDG